MQRIPVDGFSDRSKWIADDGVVYRLVQTGWDRGKAVMENEYYFHISAHSALGASGEPQRLLAKHIAALLNESEKKAINVGE